MNILITKAPPYYYTCIIIITMWNYTFDRTSDSVLPSRESVAKK